MLYRHKGAAGILFQRVNFCCHRMRRISTWQPMCGYCLSGVIQC